MYIPFILRNATSDDIDFIYNSYLLSFKKYHPQKYIPNTLYFKPQRDILAFLLENSNCMIACYPEDPSEIIGWCLYEEVLDTFTIHYIYVKRFYRGKYIASDILKQLINKDGLIIASHICDNYFILKHKIQNCKVVYDPFIISRLREIHGSK